MTFADAMIHWWRAQFDVSADVTRFQFWALIKRAREMEKALSLASEISKTQDEIIAELKAELKKTETERDTWKTEADACNEHWEKVCDILDSKNKEWQEKQHQPVVDELKEANGKLIQNEVRIEEMAGGLRYLYDACARIIDEREIRVVAARKAALEECITILDGKCSSLGLDDIRALLEPFEPHEE